MVSVTSASRYVTSASRYHSRSSMYIRGLIPRNSTGLAKAVPIGMGTCFSVKLDNNAITIKTIDTHSHQNCEFSTTKIKYTKLPYCWYPVNVDSLYLTWSQNPDALFPVFFKIELMTCNMINMSFCFV